MASNSSTRIVPTLFSTGPRLIGGKWMHDDEVTEADITDVGLEATREDIGSPIRISISNKHEGEEITLSPGEVERFCRFLMADQPSVQRAAPLIEGHDRPVTADEVLSYLDYFAGQENDAEEVRDFAQAAARMVHEGRTRRDFGMQGYAGFVEWLDERGVD